MMPINEAAEVLKKLLACRTNLYCRTYCSECPHDETHSRKIAALEAAIEYIERSERRTDETD